MIKLPAFSWLFFVRRIFMKVHKKKDLTYEDLLKFFNNDPKLVEEAYGKAVKKLNEYDMMTKKQKLGWALLSIFGF